MPIEGEAGVGYRLGQGFELPPLMFTQDEARALVASVRMAQVWQDPALAQASQVALGKILSVLPTAARAAAQSMAIYAPPLGLEPEVQVRLQTLREAAQDHRKVSMAYRDATQTLSQRVVRHDFRSFRLDRMDALQPLDGQAGQFRDEAGKTLADYLRSVAPAAALAHLTDGA